MTVDEYQAPLGDVLDTPQPSVGERLRRARVDKGLELADIATDTRIPLRHLTAIENDAHDSLPALTYTIGFVRTFARVVDLPQGEIIAQFKAETSKVAHVPQPVSMEPIDEARLPSRGVVAASSAAVIAIIAGLWAWGAGVFESTPPPPPAEVAAVAEPAVPEPVAVDASAEQPLVSPDTPVSNTGDIGVPPPAVPAAAPVAGAVQLPQTGAAQPTAAGPVTITATEDVWIKVYDRAERKTVKMGILAPGETYQVPADRNDLLLWTGRAGALRVSVGGRAVTPLGGPRDTVQDVSLAPADLLARAAR